MNNIKNTLAKDNFVNLHGHSCFSLFDGFGFPQEHMNFAHGNEWTVLPVATSERDESRRQRLQANLWR